MQFNLRQPSESTKAIILCALSTLILYLGFFTNTWKVANQEWFLEHQHDMESFILGRLVKSGQDGVFSDGGLTGVVSRDETPVGYVDRPFYFQYAVYLNELPSGAYTTYNSQIGGQGILFSALDRILPLTPPEKLTFYRAFTSMLTALTLTTIILWFYFEFGLSIAIFVLASAVIAQWLVVFGRNLWWSTWAFYLPMAVVMHYLRHNRAPTKRQLVRFGILIAIVVFIKCLINGYEYISTTLIMMMVPFVYYSLLDKLSLRRFGLGLFYAALGSGIAILLSFSILFFQIASVTGKLQDGVDHVIYALQKRTYADSNKFPAQYAPSYEANPIVVIAIYLKGTFFNANNYISTSNPLISRFIFHFRYLYLIILLLIMSVYMYFRRNSGVTEKKRQKSLALITTTWFSLLAPLSWFIIFKAHSFIHTHMNHLVWQMPFTLFCFAVFGVFIQKIISDLSHLLRRYW
jgi:hypothetical protein